MKFLGTHHSRLDPKGRTSVPSTYRTTLRNGVDAAPASLILRASHNHACIEGWPAEVFWAMTAPLDRMDLFSADEDDLSVSVFGDATALEADKDGRIILPDELIRYAGLSDTAVFMGRGRLFEIWEPDGAARRSAEARERARSRGLTIPGLGQRLPVPAAAP